MGYYGLGPGMRVADQLTPFEKCLRSIPMENWQKSLDILETLLKNIAQNQREEKFRKIRLSNAKIKEAITSVEYALQALLEMGWKLSADESDCLVLPESVKVSFPTHVNKVIDAKQFYKKEEEKVRVSKGLSRVPPGGANWKSMFEDERSAEQKEKESARNMRRLQRRTSSMDLTQMKSSEHLGA